MNMAKKRVKLPRIKNKIKEMQDCFSSFPYVHLLPRNGQGLMSIFRRRRRCHSLIACLAGWAGIFNCFRKNIFCA